MSKGKGKGWDMTSTHSLECAAEWIRAQADATAVFVVRGNDYAFAVAPDVRPADAREAIEFVLPDAAADIAQRRQAEKDAAVRRRAAAIAGLGDGR